MIIVKKYKILIVLLSFSINIIAQKNTYISGKINFDKGKYETAIKDLDLYINIKTNNTDAYFVRAKAKMNLKMYYAAIEDFKMISTKKNPVVSLYLARLYSVLNNEHEAILHLKTYLKLKKKLAEEKLIAYPEFGYIDNCLEWGELWAENWYSKKEVLLNNAEDEFNSANFQLAENMLNDYVLKYKANSHAFYLKAQLSVKRKNDKEALAYFDKAIELDSKNKYLIAKAEAEYRLKKYKKSLKLFNSAFVIDSLNLEINYGRSAVYSALNEHEMAMADINKYLYYYPDKANGLVRFAKINRANGDFLNAIHTYGKLIAKYPGKSIYLKERANAYMATHTYRYAIKDYSMALDLNPRDAEIYFQKGNAHFQLKEMQKACLNWKRALKYGNSESEKLIYKYCR